MARQDQIALFTQNLSELSLAVDNRRKEIDTSILCEQEAIEALDRLRARMVGAEGGVFDRDDVSMVDEEINAHKDALRDMKRSLEAEQAKQVAHAKLFQEMSGALIGRSTVLEEENSVLSDHLTLLSRLAKKQLELETMLQERLRLATSLR